MVQEEDVIRRSKIKHCAHQRSKEHTRKWEQVQVIIAISKWEQVEVNIAVSKWEQVEVNIAVSKWEQTEERAQILYYLGLEIDIYKQIEKRY